MVINVIPIRNFLCFNIIIFLALSFPLQVIMMNPWPSTLPYFFFILLFLLSFNKLKLSINWFSWNRIDLVVVVFIFLVLLHSFWQLIFGIISISESLKTIFIYVFPVCFYWYFSRKARPSEIKAILIGIIISGVISALFFAYDSYMKIGFGIISDYSKQAETYVNMRMNNYGEFSSMRAVLGYRSYGLMEKHSISAIWVVFAALASLSLISHKRKYLRLISLSIFGLMLIIALNFTSIAAYFLVIMLVEFHYYSLLSGKISKAQRRSVIYLFSAIIIIISVINIYLNENMIEFILLNLTGQIQLATTGGQQHFSFFDLIISSFNGYIVHCINYPLIILFGDGFSDQYGMGKGGDVGFIETMARLGLPFFTISVYGIIRIFYITLKNISPNRDKIYSFMNEVLIFSASIIFLLLIMEIHYSVWNNKSVLPIFFMALGLLRTIIWVRPSSINIPGNI